MNVNRPEIIEAFLSGKLSEVDKTAFETLANQDPLFKSEIELQQDIVRSIKTYRKNELKARLNNVDLSTSTVQYAAFKIAASALFTAFLGLGVYYFYTQSSDQVEQKIVKQEITLPQSQTSNHSVQTEVKSEARKSEVNSEVTSPNTDNIISKKRITSSNEIESNEVVVSPNVVDSFKEQVTINKNVELEDKIKSNTPATDKITEVQILNEDLRSSSLRYKYLNKKLYLYGDFSTSPYELLEVNITSDLGKKLFLYHNGTYYQLNENQKSVTALLPIVDSLVIAELDTLKTKGPSGTN